MRGRSELSQGPAALVFALHASCHGWLWSYEVQCTFSTIICSDYSVGSEIMQQQHVRGGHMKGLGALT